MTVNINTLKEARAVLASRVEWLRKALAENARLRSAFADFQTRQMSGGGGKDEEAFWQRNDPALFQPTVDQIERGGAVMPVTVTLPGRAYGEKGEPVVVSVPGTVTLPALADLEQQIAVIDEQLPPSERPGSGLGTRRCLYQFHWLALRSGLSSADPYRIADAMSRLRQYIGACPGWDPEINRVYRALDWAQESLAEAKARRPGKAHKGGPASSPEEGLRLLKTFHAEMSTRWEALSARTCPIVLTEPEQRRELAEAYAGGQRPVFEKVREELAARLKTTAPGDLKEEARAYLALMALVAGENPSESSTAEALAL